jgi:hypothetical protein
MVRFLHLPFTRKGCRIRLAEPVLPGTDARQLQWNCRRRGDAFTSSFGNRA